MKKDSPGYTREFRGLDDPTGQSDEECIATVRAIEKKILELKERIENKQIYSVHGG
jgi:hypothetical protein